jgi:hypothetical protein
MTTVMRKIVSGLSLKTATHRQKKWNECVLSAWGDIQIRVMSSKGWPWHLVFV